MSKGFSEIKAIFGPGGKLEKALRDFEFRCSQRDMALLIAGAIKSGQPAAVEAGTGTGKTFGYLIPLVLSGEKAVISTGTKNLQEQIVLKDIPILEKALGLSVDAVLMKGRRNYLCLYRYDQNMGQRALFDDEEKRKASRIEQWLKTTVYADRSELEWMADGDPDWDNISASSEQCLGSKCPFGEDCFLNRLRARAAKASIVIVNHHLFFADMKVREAGFGGVIPRCEIAVFDEAHEIENTATAYFGLSVGTAQVTELADDLEREIRGSRAAGGGVKERRSMKVKDAARDLFSHFRDCAERGGLDEATLLSLAKGPVAGLSAALEELADDPCVKKSDSAGIQAIGARAGAISAALKDVVSKRDQGWVHWYERRKRSVSIYCSPLDISGRLSELLYSKFSSVIITSATLSTGEGFSYIASRLGLPQETRTGLFPSHFDFKKQSILYIPDDLPSPDEAGFGPAVAKRIEEIVRRSSGRALVLFTSYQNLNLTWERLDGRLPYRLLRQGSAPRASLLNDFKEDIHSVLLATSSFWQGVDVPGEALSCLIIDKLPFESPSDPLVAARIREMNKRGDNPFMGYQIPVAELSLKQGIGRLIRKKSDIGVVALLDKRVITRSYGAIFLESIPPIPLTRRIEDITDFFKEVDFECSPGAGK